MGLLDGQIKNIIGSAVDFLMLDATLIQIAGGSFNPATGLISGDAATNTAMRGFVDESLESSYRRDNLIDEGERVVVLTQKGESVAPTAGDRVTIRGTTSTILRVHEDPAQATWTCVVRAE